MFASQVMQILYWYALIESSDSIFDAKHLKKQDMSLAKKREFVAGGGLVGVGSVVGVRK